MLRVIGTELSPRLPSHTARRPRQLRRLSSPRPASKRRDRGQGSDAGLGAAHRGSGWGPFPQNGLLLVMEAMKMENEIFAPVSGTVKKILVKQGDQLMADDVLAIIG